MELVPLGQLGGQIGLPHESTFEVFRFEVQR